MNFTETQLFNEATAALEAAEIELTPENRRKVIDALPSLHVSYNHIKSDGERYTKAIIDYKLRGGLTNQIIDDYFHYRNELHSESKGSEQIEAYEKAILKTHRLELAKVARKALGISEPEPVRIAAVPTPAAPPKKKTWKQIRGYNTAPPAKPEPHENSRTAKWMKNRKT